MKIKTKILLAFSFLLVTLLVNGYVFLNQIDKVSQPTITDIPKNLQILAEKTRLEDLADSIRYYDEVLTQAARNFAFTGNKKWEKIYLDTEPKLGAVIKEAKQKGNDKEKNFFSSIESANATLVEMEYKSIDLVNAGKNKEAVEILESGRYWEQKTIYKTNLDNYRAERTREYGEIAFLSKETVTNALTETKKSVNDSKIIILSVTAFVILFFILCAFFFSSLLSSSVQNLLSILEKIKRGKLEGDGIPITDDEIGDLSKSINDTIQEIKKTEFEATKKVEIQTKELSQKSEDLDNQKNAILNILEDVEREKEKSDKLANDLKKFQLAVENAVEMVVITDPEGILVYGNKAVKRITGYEVSEAIGKKAAAFWKSPMPKEYYQEMWRIIKIEKKTFHGQLQNRRKNGEMYEADISLSPVLDDNGNVIFFVGIERDITKEKEVDKAKTEFVSLASHQLRTPLSSINWYTEMLLGGEVGELNEGQKNYLKEVYASSQRMGDLVGTLLNVSRLELGTFAIEPSTVDVSSLSKSELNEMKPTITEKKIVIKETYGENINEFQADKRLLTIVLQNLLSNAIKYTNNNGEVSISIQTLQEGTLLDGRKMTEESLAITVADSGIGVPKSQQDKIFTKLFRADNAASSRTEGTGLGLYIVKAIVEQSGGQVWFTSEENIGTTFYVSFPRTGMKKKEGTKSLG
ncbi:MAG: ATP-binding protein [Candidatus Parcubacteria bacterium]|nr:ATP-binding protein [Candidatus Parcubacteria bacterium]